MLRLREQQIGCLRKAASLQFVQRVRESLRRDYPDELAGKSDATMDAVVHRGMAKAWRYGIETEDNVAAFIQLMVVYGEEFEERPDCRWLRDIVHTDSIDEEAKMDRIAQHETFRALENR